MTSKVLKANRQVIYTSTYRALTDNEMANPEEIKAQQAFDTAVSNKLGAPMSKHDLPSEDVDADTPTFEPYENFENPPLRLPKVDEVTPEASDSYVGAQVNLPIGGLSLKALSSVVHETLMGISNAEPTSTLYWIQEHMKWSFQTDRPLSSLPTRFQSICLPNVTQQAICTYCWTPSLTMRSMILPSPTGIDIFMSTATSIIERPHVGSRCVLNGRMVLQHGNN